MTQKRIITITGHAKIEPISGTYFRENPESWKDFTVGLSGYFIPQYINKEPNKNPTNIYKKV